MYKKAADSFDMLAVFLRNNRASWPSRPKF